MLSTMSDLYRGVGARGSEPATTAAIKGGLAMAGVVAAAVRGRQQVPDRPVDVVIEREALRLAPSVFTRCSPGRGNGPGGRAGRTTRRCRCSPGR